MAKRIAIPIPTPAPAPIVMPRDLAKRFLNSREIGHGAYGVVFKARDALLNRDVAVKVMELDPKEQSGFPVELLREITLLGQLSTADHVVKFFGPPLFARCKAYLVFELANGSLKELMGYEGPKRDAAPSRGKHIDSSETKSFMRDILLGLRETHSMAILHRDLKPDNILFFQDAAGKITLKLTDMGLSRGIGASFFRAFAESRTPEVGTRKEGASGCFEVDVQTITYRAPEILLMGEFPTQMYGPEIDVWSAGIIFLEMIRKRGAHMLLGDVNKPEDIFRRFAMRFGTPQDDFYDAVARRNPYAKDALPRGFKQHSSFMREYEHLEHPFLNYGVVSTYGAPIEANDLLEKMLEYVPGKRISAREALGHPYFSGAGGGARGQYESLFD